MLPPSFTPQYLSRLELFRLRSRRAFLGSRQGGHISLKRGHGIEFSDYRKYELGDNPRHIDWGVYARTDRLYVKRFQEEQDLSALILLDTSTSMTVPAGEKKWDMARDIALTLAYVALMEHDSVYMSALGEFHSPSFYGGKAIHRLSDILLGLNNRNIPDIEHEVMRAAARIRFPGVAVFISDFLMPLEVIFRSFNILRAKNLDVTAIQVLSPSDMNPLPAQEGALAVDSETGERLDVALGISERKQYADLLAQHNQSLRSFLEEAHIPYSLAQSSVSLSAFVQEELPQTGLIA